MQIKTKSKFWRHFRLYKAFFTVLPVVTLSPVSFSTTLELVPSAPFSAFLLLFFLDVVVF
jgi:hypothetical protein